MINHRKRKKFSEATILLMVTSNKTVYFDKPEPQNTSECLKATKTRFEELGLGYVVIASDSGKTALKAGKAFENLEASVVCVTSHPGIREASEEVKPLSGDVKERLEEQGVEILERQPYIFKETSFDAQYLGRSAPSWSIHEFVSRTMGYGFKTALEVTLIATEAGAIPPEKEVMAIAGTGWLGGGADAALVVSASPVMEHINLANGLEVREVVAIPRKKFSKELIKRLKSEDTI